MLAEAYVRKFEYNLQDKTLADRAGEEAGVALRLNQSSAPAHVVLAMINYSQTRFDGALGEAQKAVSLDPRYARAWRELGRVQFRLGRREEAEKAYPRRWRSLQMTGPSATAWVRCISTSTGWMRR